MSNEQCPLLKLIIDAYLLMSTNFVSQELVAIEVRFMKTSYM